MKTQQNFIESKSNKLINSNLIQNSNNKLTLINYVSSIKSTPKNYQHKINTFDYQHLKEENFILKKKVQQLQQQNIDSRTKILVVNQQCKQLQKKVENQRRSISVHYKSMSSRNLLPENYQQQREKQKKQVKTIHELKKIIRELKIQLQQVKNEGQLLKKAAKITRISELQVQNKQLFEQNLRLEKIAEESKAFQIQNYQLYMSEMHGVNKKLKLEQDREKKSILEYQRKDEELLQMKRFVMEIENNKKRVEEKMRKEIRQLKDEMAFIKKHYNLTSDFQRQQKDSHINKKREQLQVSLEELKAKYQEAMSYIYQLESKQTQANILNEKSSVEVEKFNEKEKEKDAKKQKDEEEEKYSEEFQNSKDKEEISEGEEPSEIKKISEISEDYEMI